MRVRLGAALLAIATAGLLAGSPAFGADFHVTGTADSSTGSCGAADADGLHPCSTLRAAIEAANLSPDAEDNVLLLVAGTYALTEGELSLKDGVSLFGVGARSIRIENATGRILSVPAGATVLVVGVTIAGGSVDEANGANILNEGDLELFQTRVTGGNARFGSGGGIANVGGSLAVTESLIDSNRADFSGGGIENTGLVSNPANLVITDSTIADNSGGGIRTDGTGNSVELTHVTFNVNVPGGALTIPNNDQTVTTVGSIFTTDVQGDPNCSGITPTDLGYNIDTGTSCAFTGPGSRPTTDPQLSGGLRSDLGGPTDVYSIETSSPAADLVAQCGSPFDQRGYLRSASPLEPCDAGAYEIGGQPIVEPTPTPSPTPAATAIPTATPAATAARAIQTPVPTAAPTPVAGESVGAKPVSGKVLVKLAGTNTFVPLDPSVIKNGAEIDTRKGVIEISRPDGSVAKFYDGIFKLSQPGGITTLTLTEKLDCKTSGKANAAAKKPKTRKLWGDGKGKFRTRGQYSAATIRGTKWLVQDTCTTTTTKVTQGAVTVQDLVKKKTILLRKGKSYTARSKR